MEKEALVVGINSYPYLKKFKYGDLNLDTPAKDAESIAQLLEEYGNFRVQRLPESYEEKQRRVVATEKDAMVTVRELQKKIINLFNPPDHNSFSGIGYSS